VVCLRVGLTLYTLVFYLDTGTYSELLQQHGDYKGLLGISLYTLHTILAGVLVFYTQAGFKYNRNRAIRFLGRKNKSSVMDCSAKPGRGLPYGVKRFSNTKAEGDFSSIQYIPAD
jgi:hypothetical protein